MDANYCSEVRWTIENLLDGGDKQGMEVQLTV
jgi:hypothetical protein